MEKIGIIGMDIAFEGCPDVAAFERLVYAGLTLPGGAAAPVRDAEQVAECALRDAGLPASARVVTLYACGGSQSAAAFHTLIEARRLLAAGETDAALIVENNAPGACAVVLARDDAPSARVYATLNALRLGTTDNIAATCAQALADAGVTATDIGYLEAPDCDPAQACNATQTGDNMAGVLAAYRASSADLTCAIGSVRALLGTRFALAGLLKTALCLYRRYLPPSTGWAGPQNPAQWQDSGGWSANLPFYAPAAARPWLLGDGTPQRYAALDQRGDAVHVHMILAEPAQRSASEAVCSHLTEKTPRLFPLAGDSREGLHAQLIALRRDVETDAALSDLAQRAFGTFRQRPNAAYAVAIVGHDAATTLREIDFGLAGLDKAFESGKPWASPQGSYFTPTPLGQTGNVAFVYPGAFNAYLDMGRDLFQVFPRLHELFGEVTARPGRALAARLLYPRSLHPLSDGEIQAVDAQLRGDPLAMIESGASLAILHTRLLRDIFGVQPRATLGYSLGEVSMLWAFGVWRDGDAGNEAWRNSPLFATRLCGPMEAVRESWGLPSGAKADLWRVYILKAPVERVQALVQREPRVYLTIINAPQEVVIAGDPQGCARVIAALDCHALHVPFDAAIHNAAMRSEHGAFVDLYTHPVYPVPGIDFYSAAGYAPLTLDSGALARAMADMSCAPIDFPRLINTAYAGGARLFIEMGPQGTCSRWIRRILADKPHAAIPINRSGAGDYATALAALALLVSHRVPMDLSPLYDSPEAPAPVAETQVWQTQYPDDLSQHAARVVEGHAAFLEARQVALRQTGALLQMHLAAAQQTLSTAFPPESQRSCDFQIAPPPRFNKTHLTAFAAGSLVNCFGPLYDIYRARRIPRIPNGDLLMMSRILEIDGQQGEVQIGAGLTSEYDVPADTWFYRESGCLPYALLMEIALQPCGFLSAYLGSILPYPETDFYFRNLDGEGTLNKVIDVRGKTLTNRVQLTVSTAIRGIIVQKYTFAVACEGDVFYQGSASFGYFTPQALENQVGLDGGQAQQPWLHQAQAHHPVAVDTISLLSQTGRLSLLENAVVADEGRYGRGYVYADAPIDPRDWFFACHFYEDPVMPGSLGVEAMLQALQVYARHQGIGGPAGPLPRHTTTWTYRGQVPPEHDSVRLEVHVSDIVADAEGTRITGDASLWWKNRRIYEVKGLGLQLGPTTN